MTAGSGNGYGDINANMKQQYVAAVRIGLLLYSSAVSVSFAAAVCCCYCMTIPGKVFSCPCCWTTVLCC